MIRKSMYAVSYVNGGSQSLLSLHKNYENAVKAVQDNVKDDLDARNFTYQYRVVLVQVDMEKQENE